MSIKRYTSIKDNTISSAFKLNLSSRGTDANMGASDILEMYSIFAQASSSSIEQSRILVEFPLATISSQRDSGIIPTSGSVTFKLKMFNAEHNQTTPSDVTVETRILTQKWSEGSGLDMESFLDSGASSWTSASTGNAWFTTGGDFLSSSYIASSPVPLSYTQFLSEGTENLDIDVTPIVEEYIKNVKSTGTNATGSIVFNTTHAPSVGQSFKIYTYQGDHRIFQFSNTSGSSGKTVFVLTGSSASGSSSNLIDAINTNLGSFIAATGQDNDLTASLSQRAATFYGNTIISSSVPSATASVTNFTGGSGAINYGFILKLSGSQEDGSASRSYYTKKFFARSSHHQLERPVLEAQWDSSVKDDRADVIKSSSLAPASDNLNNIYLYNRIRNKLVDIPNTGSLLLTRLLASTKTGLPVTASGPSASGTFITASKNSTGIYKAQFAYNGSETTLYDVWQASSSSGITTLFTGSAITVSAKTPESFYQIPTYLTKITNLKSSYAANEQATFRVFTRDKNKKPNIYTVASNQAQVTTIREGYYKICRVADDMTIIDYSTSSVPSYSSLSYDASGSYFDLDMSILEPNYLYEIRLLYKDENDYIEQKEKFKFRVDP